MSGQRQAYPYHSAGTEGAADCAFSAVPGDHGLHQGQSHPAAGSVARPAAAHQLAQDVRQLVGLDTPAGVGHLDYHVRVLLEGPQGDGTAGLAVFHRVGDQIMQRQLLQIGIAKRLRQGPGHVRDGYGDLPIFAARQFPSGFPGRLQQFCQRYRETFHCLVFHSHQLA